MTTKDPKKVEAGKRLAEYNRKKREELKNQQVAALQTQTPRKDESRQDSGAYSAAKIETSLSEGKSDYIIYGVISLITVGGIGYYVYQSKKNTLRRVDSSTTSRASEAAKEPQTITPQSKIPVRQPLQ